MKHESSLHDEYVEIFMHENYMLVLSAIRYLSTADKQTILTMTDIPPDEFERIIAYLVSHQLVLEFSGGYRLTSTGEDFFELVGMSALDTRSKRFFKSCWLKPMEAVMISGAQLLKQINSFQQCTNQLYFYNKRRFDSVKDFDFWFRKFCWNRIPEPEVEFWKNPLTHRLFEIWIENIRGAKSGIRVEAQERVEFIQYILEKLHIAHHPDWANTSENFHNLAFSLKMLRPNNQAQIYLIFSFIMRPLKNYIREYFDLALITGDYELLLRRFPPWFRIIKINPSPGERTVFDLRGLDFRPLTFRTDMQYTVALELEHVKTRSNDRYISCLIVADPELEQEKAAKIDKMKQGIANIFKCPDYLTNIEFNHDGKVYYTGANPKIEIPNYGGKRSAYIQKTDELEIFKAIPCPSPQSGLIIRFSLMPPVQVLLNGISGKRGVSLDEIMSLWVCLDLCADFIRTSDAPLNQHQLNQIIDQVFQQECPSGVTVETLQHLSQIQQLRSEDQTDERAWKYLTDRLLEGKGKDLLQAINIRLEPDAFDVVFSLMPLLAGIEISFTPSGDIVQSQTRKKITLIDNLRRELEDLLRQVFSTYLDFSAATNLACSEMKLAEMIVTHCLNLKSDPQAFAEALEQHLNQHYLIHSRFMQEYDKTPGKWGNTYEQLPVDLIKQIRTDIRGITSLIEHTRERLLSPGKNNRLLRFIEPESIVVQINDFVFEGATLDHEKLFIMKMKEAQSQKSS